MKSSIRDNISTASGRDSSMKRVLPKQKAQLISIAILKYVDIYCILNNDIQLSGRK